MYRQIAVAVLIACLALPAAASATTRYAAPGGGASPAVCTSPDAPKCSIGAAAGGTGVATADEAVILPGNYSDAAGDLNGDAGNIANSVEPTAGMVHGVPGAGRPVITLEMGGTSAAFQLNSGTTLSDVEIDTATNRSNIIQFGGTVQRVIARSSSSTSGTVVCVHNGGVVRDSACLSSGSDATALGASLASPVGSTLAVRNVTAIATGSGSTGASYAFFGGGPTVNWLVSVRNTIARGASKDIFAGSRTSGALCPKTTIEVDYSNWVTAETFADTGCTAVVSAGTHNQIAAPNLAEDGFHQVDPSPGTTDKGTSDSIGPLDIDGQTRQIGLQPDIGADELAIASSTAVTCSPDPVTRGRETTCTATVTAGAEELNGKVDFSSSGPGSFTPPSCTATGLTTASCSVSYTPDAIGSGSHKITAAFAGDSKHDGSNGSTAAAVTEPAKGGQTADDGGDPCATLREQLRKAKAKLRAARRSHKPVRKKRAKVRRLTRVLAAKRCG